MTETRRFAQFPHQGVPRVPSTGVRARLIVPASAIRFTRRDARKAHTRAFRTPDRPVPIPNAEGRTAERDA